MIEYIIFNKVKFTKKIKNILYTETSKFCKTS